ncbi:TIGR02569 family protein [Georgenia sp. AZ-5]|uniref:TIGR02569 family protein n=1 Tax=Georgenia sp. AZ-5 TaxID=3367526 RepID=UPI0037540A0C
MPGRPRPAGRPGAAVLEAFGAPAEPVPLRGGKGTAWRAGGIVLKPLDMPAEALEWQAGVLADVDRADDVRVAPPLRARDGRLVVDGWTGWRFERGALAAGRWLDVMAAGRAFHGHLRGHSRPEFLDRRDDPWAVADRVAWGEDAFHAGAGLPHVGALLAARRPVTAPPQLVHGDLTDNVHFAPGLPPVVLDFSPCWRPIAYASAVVVADAVVFRGAAPGLIWRAAAREGAEFPQLLVRALLFRAVGDQLLAPDKVPTWVEMFAPAVRAAVDLAGAVPAAGP